MKKARMLGALVALALFVGMAITPLSTLAQFAVGEPNSFHQILQGQPISLINRSDSTARLLSGDASGNLSNVEQYPAMDQNLTFASIISNASLAPGVGDSSAILDTHRMRLGTLLIKCTPITMTAADSLGGCRLAIQIRTHLNGSSDSSSTFAFYMQAQTGTGAVTTVASQLDTSLTGQTWNAANLAATVNTAFSGEFTVFVAGSRMGPGVGAISTWARLFGYPNGLAIPLSGQFGRDIYSPYTSIRVRNLGGGAGAGHSCVLTVSLVGTPL